MRLAVLLATVAVLGIYAVSAAVVFGVALQRLIPRLAVKHMEATTWYKTVKAVNTAALILGTSAFAVLFTDAFESLLDDNKAAAAIAVSALALRWITKCYRSITPKKAQPAVLGSVEATTFFVLPVSLASIGIYMLLGHVFWLTLSGWTLMFLATLLLMAGGCSFLYWKAGIQAAKAVQSASRMFIALFSLLAAVAVQLVVRNDSPHLLTLPFALFIILVACTLLWQGALMSTKRADHGVWWYVAFILLTSPLLFALANQPWVVYGQFTYDQAFGGLYGPTPVIVIVTLIVGMLLSLIPWWLTNVRKR